MPLETVYARALQRIEIMDQTGYDAVWLAEHHFSTFSVCPSVHADGHARGRAHAPPAHRHGRLAGRASTTRCGSPRRSRCSTCSRAGGSTGAPAAASTRTEFRAFGVTPEESAERFRERVEIVLAAWRDERRRLRRPHFAASTTSRCCRSRCSARTRRSGWRRRRETAIEWAAQRGHSILMDPHAAHVEIGRKRELYRERARGARAHVRRARDPDGAPARGGADGRAGARGRARAGAQWIVGSYMGDAHAMTRRHLTSERSRSSATLRGSVIHGSPESVLEQIAAAARARSASST